MDGPSYRTLRIVSLAVGIVALLAGPASAVCPGPCGTPTCTISAPTALNDGCVLSWTGKAIVVDTAGTLEVPTGGSFTVIGQSLTVRGLLKATAGSIVVSTTGKFRTENSGHVDANGVDDPDVGSIQITGSPIEIVGQSWVRADGAGADIDICGGTRTQIGACNRTGAVTISSNPAAGAVAVGGNDTASIVINGASVLVDSTASIVADSAELEGSGGSIAINADGNVTINGKVTSNKTDSDGSGGDITVVANGTGAIAVGSNAVLQAVGGNGFLSGDGTIQLGPACTVTFAGTMDSNGGTHSGTNGITYRSTLNATGGRGDAGADGSNTVRCRNNGSGACVNAPTGINQQKFNPDAVTVPVTLAQCANACGNGIVEGTEQCDDGNSAICDGCENCVITSLTAPCNDGDACTTNDVCSSFKCVGALRDCDDGNPCTLDSCNPSTGCAHSANTCQYQLAMSITDVEAHIGTAEGQPLTSVGTDIGVTGSGVGVSVFNGATGVRRFTVPDPGDVADFGRSISGVGSKLIVGVPNGLGANPGDVRVYNAVTGALLRTIPNPAPAGHSYSFGWSVAASGTDDVIVGVPVDDGMGTMVTGAAYRMNLSSGALLTSYFAPINTVQGVGWSVSALAGRVGVGAPDGFTSNGALSFPVDGSSTLLISGPTGDPYDLFGESVALLAAPSGTANVVVSDRDATERAFVYDGSSGALLLTLSPNVSGEGFGFPVAGVAGNAVVGAQGPAQARLFNGLTGTLIQSLSPPSGLGPVVAAARGSDILVGGSGGVNVYKTKCGNGIVEAGEQCDDGNTRDDDCCTSQCQFAPPASTCNNGNPCAHAICDINHHCAVLSCLAGVPCGVGGTCSNSCTCQP